MGRELPCSQGRSQVIDAQLSWVSLGTLEETGSGVALGRGLKFRSSKVDPDSNEYSHSSLVLWASCVVFSVLHWYNTLPDSDP